MKAESRTKLLAVQIMLVIGNRFNHSVAKFRTGAAHCNTRGRG